MVAIIVLLPRAFLALTSGNNLLTCSIAPFLKSKTLVISFDSSVVIIPHRLTLGVRPRSYPITINDNKASGWYPTSVLIKLLYNFGNLTLLLTIKFLNALSLALAESCLEYFPNSL